MSLDGEIVDKVEYLLSVGYNQDLLEICKEYWKEQGYEDVDSITGGTFQFEKPNNDLTTTTTAGIPLAPPIRKATNNDDVIDYVLPVFGVFMLTSASSWDTKPGLISSFTIEAVEDVLQ